MKPRAKIIPDKLFFKLWKAANEGYDKHNYISNFTSSTSVDFVDFKNKYGIYYEEATEMLTDYSHRQACGVLTLKFCL